MLFSRVDSWGTPALIARALGDRPLTITFRELHVSNDYECEKLTGIDNPFSFRANMRLYPSF